MLLREMRRICLADLNVQLLLLVLIIPEVDAEIWRPDRLQAISPANGGATLIVIVHRVDHSVLRDVLLVGIVIGLRIHIPAVIIVLIVVDGGSSILWRIHLAGVKHIQFVHVARVELRAAD